ncbi:DUF2806 domain-containing protein [Burkholderia gladioli]|uniref:DUF2806 domain-containing protein n=1 Tax=Burkholderia gladioli TaxID=28095 RepID=UPI003F7A77F3
MSDDIEKGALVNVGDLTGFSKPAVKLFDRVSDALGGVFRPWQIRRVAAAEADAAVVKARGVTDAARVKAIAKIELETELEERTLRRVLAQEVKRQANIESIVVEAAKSVAPDANPEKIDEDWMELFLERSKLISNQDMQRVWARLLSGEANKPGHFSRRTLEIVAGMNREDAELFVALCRLTDRDFFEGTPFVFDLESDINHVVGLRSLSLAHLESLGLIQLLEVGNWQWSTSVKGSAPGHIKIILFGRTIHLKNPAGCNFVFNLGRVAFTRYGRELLAITEALSPPPDIVDIVLECWRKEGYVVEIV